MSFYAERHIQKTAKPHRCTGCLEMIPAGSPATYLAGKHDDFWTAYICGDCKVYMDEYDDYFVDDDQRWNEGDIGEARREREAGGAL